MFEMNIVNGYWGDDKHGNNENSNGSHSGKEEIKTSVHQNNNKNDENSSTTESTVKDTKIFKPINDKREVSDAKRLEDAYNESKKEEEKFVKEHDVISYDFKPLTNPEKKYGNRKTFEPVMEEIIWPQRKIIVAPRWCSVDLRDGNQALKNPMSLAQKIIHWKTLVGLGFKEIEIGFPAASKVEYDFTRILIEKNMIPDDVAIQVLSQSRKEQIEKTVEAIRGAKNAIVHLYNSTSELQRRVVFQKSEDEIIKLILDGIATLKEEIKKIPDTNVTFEYSPESFTGTEPEFAVRICNAVIDAWGPTKEHKMIINLPQTVEMATPDVFADQVEYFIKHIKNREAVIISVHPHNDMGMAVAAAMLALKAGADRVEGTIFGNGERTGNLCLSTLALNLYSMGIDPHLNFSNLDKLNDIIEYCTNTPVYSRQPYVGSEVFTARSGSHQDAISKGINMMNVYHTETWEVPYLHIDPSDIGREYEPIEINSQSGKGGVAFIVSEKLGFDMPKEMHKEFGRIVQTYCDNVGRAISDEEIQKLFNQSYFKESPFFNFSDVSILETDSGMEVSFKVNFNGEEYELQGKGISELEAVKNALEVIGEFPYKIQVLDNHHRIIDDDKIDLVSYVKITDKETGESFFGVGKGINKKNANVNAIFSAINNMKS